MLMSQQEFLVRTPIGDLRVWCNEMATETDVPTIRVDYVHEEGDIPLAKMDYDYSGKEIHTEVFGDMYADDPTQHVIHKGLRRLVEDYSERTTQRNR